MNLKEAILLGLVIFIMGGCTLPPVTNPEDALRKPSWWKTVKPEDDEGFRGIAQAVRQSQEYYKRLPPDTLLYVGPERLTALDMHVTLQNFLLIIENDSLTYEQKVNAIKNGFEFYRSVGSNGSGRVLFTGYYEPKLSCRSTMDEVHKYPLYKRPDDIIEVELSQFGNGYPKNKLLGRLDGKRVIPYFSREEIDYKNALADRNLEIMWCSDILDIFFLQIQGSGKVELDDGSLVSVLYDGKNGRSYYSIGKHLIEAGIIPKEEMSMQILRQYLRDNPDELPAVLNRNPSYVFFRLDTGPSVGNIGVPLTSGRSIATDNRLFPKGGLALISTTRPRIENGVIREWVPFTRFVMNQDTGGAIRGPGRADLFWGMGPEAEIAAGHMQQEGELYFLISKSRQ